MTDTFTLYFIAIELTLWWSASTKGFLVSSKATVISRLSALVKKVSETALFMLSLDFTPLIWNLKNVSTWKSNRALYKATKTYRIDFPLSCYFVIVLISLERLPFIIGFWFYLDHIKSLITCSFFFSLVTIHCLFAFTFSFFTVGTGVWCWRERECGPCYWIPKYV